MDSRSITSDGTLSDELSSWENRALKMELFMSYMCVVLNFVQFWTTLVILIIIFFVRKRREMFLILTPLFMLITNISGFTGTVMQLSRNEEVGEFDMIIKIMFGIYAFFLMMSHWVFGAQYLRTSLILPKLFDEATVDWMVNESKSQLKATGMQSKFAANLTLEKLQEITDKIVKEQKASISKIDFWMAISSTVMAVMYGIDSFLYASGNTS